MPKPLLPQNFMPRRPFLPVQLLEWTFNTESSWKPRLFCEGFIYLTLDFQVCALPHINTDYSSTSHPKCPYLHLSLINTLGKLVTTHWLYFSHVCACLLGHNPDILSLTYPLFVARLTFCLKWKLWVHVTTVFFSTQSGYETMSAKGKWQNSPMPDYAN